MKKIIIGDERKKEKNELVRDSYRVEVPQGAPDATEHGAEQIPLDENVWGNDYTIINKLDEKQLANRRFYVRVRYFQQIECNEIFDRIDGEPVPLTHPISFVISDISMGGIGIICDYEITTDKIFSIELVLDGIPYKVKCQLVYCIPNDDKFRAGLKIVEREKKFLTHLKIFVARISLYSSYGESAKLGNSGQVLNKHN